MSEAYLGMTIRRTARSCLMKSLFAPRRFEPPRDGVVGAGAVNSCRCESYSSCGTGSIRTYGTISSEEL